MKLLKNHKQVWVIESDLGSTKDSTVHKKREVL